MKYMLDFNRMLLIGEGYFDTKEQALSWVEENITEEMWSAQSEPWRQAWGSLDLFKGLYQAIPIYENGDERLKTHKYGRYSGGLR